MDKRLELHDILCEIVNITEPDGDRHTYFQPPESAHIKHPAILYTRKTPSILRANNAIYNLRDAYDVTVIDPHPDSELAKKLIQLPYCRHDSHYTADNLHHDKFTLYY